MPRVAAKKVLPGHVFRYNGKECIVTDDGNAGRNDRVTFVYLYSGQEDAFSGTHLDTEVEYLGSYYTWDGRFRMPVEDIDDEDTPDLSQDDLWGGTSRV